MTSALEGGGVYEAGTVSHSVLTSIKTLRVPIAVPAGTPVTSLRLEFKVCVCVG